MLPPIVEWLGIVVGVFLLTILLPGYLATRLLRLSISSKDIETVVVYSTGIALVIVPIALYWVNFFGAPINPFGVIVVFLIVGAVPSAAQLALFLRQRSRANKFG